VRLEPGRPEALLALAALVCAGAAPSARAQDRIDRRAVVDRQAPVLRGFDTGSPLSVGNGEFAFTVDATGLQTFGEAYDQGVPLGTLSQWAWHTAPNPQGYAIDKFAFTPFESHGRKVGYADVPGDARTPEIEWLRQNPHRLHLGRVGFRLTLKSGREATLEDVTDVEQRLELWEGTILTRFRLDGEEVMVETLCHPTRDAIGVRVSSPLVGRGQIGIRLRFPYGSGEKTAADWTKPQAHETKVVRSTSRNALLERGLDHDRYRVSLAWSVEGKLKKGAEHEYLLAPETKGDTLDLLVGFSPGVPARMLPPYEEVRRLTREYWSKFWSGGGAIDLSESRDPRWRELERRVVLSQYLTAIQCAGRYPPQETGLTFNSWYGKFHLEMYWWHVAQFALWGRHELLERSLGYYAAILSRAQATATAQGYAGARWPKMTDLSGRESPSSIGPFLVWQQPHPIYLAELVYREQRDRTTLERYKEIVDETAEFMASYAYWDEKARRYELGPPLQGAQEIFPKETTRNTPFELAYWRFGLETAQLWRDRLGAPREPRWQGVIDSLAPLPTRDGRYLFAETAPESYGDPRFARDHPSVTAALGFLPGAGVDPATMRRTLDWISDHWSWADTWGWDYPMLAMCAARLGQPERAIDALLKDTPKNTYRANGHNYQRPGLEIYLPGNGGLLAAVALMAAGWDGGPDRPAPGFPSDGSWTVRVEGVRKMP